MSCVQASAVLAWLIVGAAVAMVVALFAAGLAGAHKIDAYARKCEARGGVYVRTHDGYRCIEARQ